MLIEVWPDKLSATESSIMAVGEKFHVNASLKTHFLGQVYIAARQHSPRKRA